MKYVSLHHHSTNSYGDGFGPAKDHVTRVADLGMSALALTEHGNTSSHVQLEQAALAVGIKPIFGLEAYTAPTLTTRPKWHLGILAMNEQGYRNLNALVTRSWAEGFYFSPTIIAPWLKEYNEGLIVLSGCLSSKVACDLMGGKGRATGNQQDAIKTIRKFKEIFGDRYYLEVQQFPELSNTNTLNSWYGEISRSEGISLVATSDCHYPNPEDKEMQKILHAATRGSGTVAAAEAEWEYDILLTPPTSDKMIFDRLRSTGLTASQAQQAIASTAEIADRCNVTLPKADRLAFPSPDSRTSKELIWDWLREGFRYRAQRNTNIGRNETEYVKRLKHEMELIESKNFVDYFLMLSDVVKFAKDSGIPVGPARGSAAASLVCYLLRITEVDPMQFPTMVFERFLDPQRMDMPDVDLDFDDERRHEIREYLARRYGDDHVGNIGNFVRYRGRNSVVDVARVHQIPEPKAKIVKDLILEKPAGDPRFSDSLSDTREAFPQAQEVFDEYPELYYAERLEGNYKNMSVHAAGIVIAARPITDTCALYTRKIGKDKREVTVLGYDKYDAEYLGMLKADFLGLTTMGMVSICLDLIGMTLEELYQIPLDDPETLTAFKAGDVQGIFQFEGRTTRLLTNDIKPETFLELADINALSRPGPLFSGATAEYIKAKWNPTTVKHLHPILSEITKNSKFQIIYEEQVLRIVREIGGFDWTQAATIRKIVKAKKGESAFNDMRDLFISGAQKLHGISESQASQIWRAVITSGMYAFNVAHCISYSMLAFWQMWLKQHHPAEFYAAALRKVGDGKDSEVPRSKLMRDAQSHGIGILPPDLNESGRTWAIGSESGTVRAGFLQIPGIGDKMADLVVSDRAANGEFGDWSDLQRIKGVGPAKITMIREMAESDDPFGLEVAGNLLATIRQQLQEGTLGPLPQVTHRLSQDIPPTEEFNGERVVWLGVPAERTYRDAIESERSRTGKSVEEILETMKDPDLKTSASLMCYDDGTEDIYLRFNRWTFPRFKEAIEGLNLNRHAVLVDGVKKSQFGVSIQVKRFWIIDPFDDDEEGLND